MLDMRVSRTPCSSAANRAAISSISESRLLAPLPTCEDVPNLCNAMTLLKLVFSLALKGAVTTSHDKCAFVDSTTTTQHLCRVNYVSTLDKYARSTELDMRKL